MISMKANPDFPAKPWEAEATAIWDAAVEGNLQVANRLLVDVTEIHGSPALLDMMAGWIDVSAQVAGVRTYSPEHREHWKVEDWSSAGPYWQWAGDLVVARITQDGERSDHLLNVWGSLNDVTLAVMALLELCVTICRKIITGRLAADQAEVRRLAVLDRRQINLN